MAELVFSIENLLPPYLNDVPEIIRAFFPYLSLSENGVRIVLKLFDDKKNKIIFIFEIGEKAFYCDISEHAIEKDTLLRKSKIKTDIKNYLYRYFSNLTNVRLAYGSLTGVRPTNLIYRKNIPENQIERYFVDNYYVEKDKAKLLKNVFLNQKGYFSKSENTADIFINIPICRTKCKFCSFATEIEEKVRDKIPSYISCLIKEIDRKKDLIDSFDISSIYIGGGTPTCISSELLSRLLERISAFNIRPEFTVEAGRPDSISAEKLIILKNNNVTRISINPQTFNSNTLHIIGRNHDVESIYNTFEESKKMGFDINMDLIAGLPGEDENVFSNSIDECIKLHPENITIHALSLKKGSAFNNEKREKVVSGLVKRMTDISGNKLAGSGYLPYYLYRQKNIADNLENVGYCIKGKQCIYNINYMEETNTVIGIGAGATSKFVFHSENRIERRINKKNIDLYIAESEQFVND